LFILALLVIPFVDRYKKFSWKDRPWVTSFGIVGIAQILVTTYWGFYIPPDSTLSLVERLVIDPIYLYAVMILLVPLGIGFSYMMIHLAKEGERKAKMAKEKGPQKIAQINLSDKWINWVIIALIAFQVFLNIAAYNAAISGMKNMSLFLAGLILIVFAGMFHVYRYAMAKTKEMPPPPSGRKTKMTKKIASSDTKELPPPDGVVEDNSETKSIGKVNDSTTIPEQVTKNETPEIKANTADLEISKDPDNGISDIKRP
jgi:ubiquinol-cytochrome c reductase cytochrome b subunit